MPFIWTPSTEQIANANVTRFMKRHHIDSPEELVKRSMEDIEWFWLSAQEDLDILWQRPFRDLCDHTKGIGWSKWFIEGELNITDNCIDRHAQKQGEHLALIWEGDDGTVQTFNYQELEEKISRFSSVLRGSGIEKGDSVGLLLPMLPETLIAFFAILKLGAIVVPIFSGFGAEAIATRLNQATAKLLITVDGSYRRGKLIPIKPLADEAAAQVPSLKKMIVLRHARNPVYFNHHHEVWWHEELDKFQEYPETEPLPAETPCMIIYTSGTTGNPKGCVHTHAGALLQCTKELAYHFDLKPNDRFFWFTDIGWMMGPWEMIGVLSLGATLVLFEGAPDYPTPDRLWKLVEHHQITHLGISPTLIRLLKTHGESWTVDHQMKSLRMLGSTGEPWDIDSYQWFFEKVGKSRAPIINISGGTELLGCLLAPLPIQSLKACSLGGPGLGMAVDVVDESGKPLRNEIGYLVCKQPAPSMTKGFWKDMERYIETYFSKWDTIWNHGDWAKIDTDGQWFLYGRADDTIKVAGKRVGPNEIESALMRHKSVAEAAAIGVPHAIKGEAIVAFVVLRPGILPDEELRRELIGRAVHTLGKSLKPEELRFVTMLPKTRSAKILRGLIKKAYLHHTIDNLSSVEDPAALEAIRQST